MALIPLDLCCELVADWPSGHDHTTTICCYCPQPYCLLWQLPCPCTPPLTALYLMLMVIRYCVSELVWILAAQITAETIDRVIYLHDSGVSSSNWMGARVARITLSLFSVSSVIVELNCNTPSVDRRGHAGSQYRDSETA